MAVDMSQDTVLKTLKALYQPGSPHFGKAKALLDAGAKLTFGLFQFKVQVAPDVVFTAQLPAMSTKIATGDLPSVQVQLIATKLGAVIDQAYKAKFPDGPTAAVEPTDSEGFAKDGTVGTGQVDSALKGTLGDVLTAMGKVMDGVKPGEVTAVVSGGTKKASPFMQQAKTAQKVDMVLALRDAKAIGQKVKGTSGGSVYNAVAIGPVNLAVKFTSSNCSIRAETNSFTPLVKKALKEAGFTDNGTYWSLHLKLNGVNAMRAIGAVIYTMNLPFEAVGTTQAAVVDY
jgi:hypothetical protein